MKQLVIILDAAHGKDVPGKCSPDGTHREYFWSRNICRQLKNLLESNGYTVHLTAPEDNEPGLSERVKRANTFPEANKFLLSLHNNAAGSGNEWMSARGVEAWTTIGQTKSDIAVTKILEVLSTSFPELKFRYDKTDGDTDKENNWTVLTGKTYKAVLLEWCFQDNKEDLAIIKDKNYNDKLCDALLEAIEILNTIL